MTQKRGPKTPEGKARSSQNATKHGLLSARVVLEDEDLPEFLEFAARMRAELQPAGELEDSLVDDIIFYRWRSRRGVKIETALLDETHGNVMACDTRTPPGQRRRKALTASVNNHLLENVERYRTKHQRDFYAALHELKALQASRLLHIPLVPGAIRVTVVAPRPAADENVLPEPPAIQAQQLDI